MHKPVSESNPYGCPRCEYYVPQFFDCELCGRRRGEHSKITPSPEVVAAYRLGGMNAVCELLDGKLHTYGRIEGEG